VTAIHLLVDSLADAGLPNAQMGNAREIIRRLDAEKFRVSMFSCGAPDQRIAARPNTEIIYLPQRRQTPRILREYMFGSHDVVFYMKAAPASAFYTRIRQIRKDDRITIGTVESQSDLNREPTIRKDAIRLWEETVLRCDYLFSNSAAVQRSFTKEYGLPSEVVATGVDTQVFAPAERRPNVRPKVLFVGSLRPFKGPNILLDAAERFSQADFVLAGEGPTYEELRARAQENRLSNVALVGSQETGALRELYRAADVFLFPSTWEGSPKVILEAAASGLPVIARSSYQPESVIDGSTGYLVGSDEELFGRLGDLLKDEPLRRRLGEAGRALSLHFDWDVITRQWEQIFLRLVDSRNGRHHA
jgi:glycosyltransferase involved in cell wall biosynthesis